MKDALYSKRCPVCGKHPKIEQADLGYKTEVTVYCKRMFRKCHALVRTLYYSEITAREQAVKLWDSVGPGRYIVDVSGYQNWGSLEE